MKRLFLLIVTISIICPNAVFSQDFISTDISFYLPSFPNRSANVAYYYGNKVFLADSILLDAGGRSLLKSEFHEGLYVLILPDSSTFEFMITDNSRYAITCPIAGTKNGCELKSNPVAEAYVSYQNQLHSLVNKSDSLRKIMQRSKDANEKPEINKQILDQHTRIDSISFGFIEQYAGSLPANYIKALTSAKLTIPQLSDPGINRDPALPISGINLNYQHYFDNIEWNDERLIYTPVIADKINYFLDKLASHKPLQLAQTIDTIVARTKNSAVRQFVLKLLLEKYSLSKHEALVEYAYLHLIEKYILPDNDVMATADEKNILREEFMQLKPVSLLSPAPEISLPDKNGNLQSLHQIDSKYTFIFFWDYNCNICRRVLTDLVRVISKYKSLDIQVYTICTGSDLAIWEAFLAKKMPASWINTYQTGPINYADRYHLSNVPAIFLLDKEKTIQGKDLTIPEIDAFLLNSATDANLKEEVYVR
jgi:hypothetical protein